MTQNEIIKAIAKTIDDSVSRIQAVVPAKQRSIYDAISLAVKDLELRNGRIVPSVANNARIVKLRMELGRIMADHKWLNDVTDFVNAFKEVQMLHNEYFRSLESNFNPSAIIQEVAKQSVDATIKSLSEAGISSSVFDKIGEVLRQNITTGASYTQFMEMIREQVMNTDTGEGSLQRYVKQITTDSLNQFSRQYSTAISADLNLEWYMYTGAIIDTSRPFCKAMVKKKYFHRSEIPMLLAGKFQEFKQFDGKINKRTDLPEGMVAGTNSANFYVYAGGYQCNHQIHPVNALAVPLAIRNRF